MWVFYACLSALFAAATAILGKVGIQGISSNLATAIRTIFVPVSYTHLDVDKRQGSGHTVSPHLVAPLTGSEGRNISRQMVERLKPSRSPRGERG